MDSKTTKEILRKSYNDACNKYVAALLRAWDLKTSAYGFWVGNEIGGVYCYGDELFINMDDIVYMVENDVTLCQYEKYMEYSIWANSYGFTTPNLKSFINGCPIIPIEKREELDKQKRMLEELVKETKKNLDEGKY